MSELISIGMVPWTDEEMRGSIEEFMRLYYDRPIRNNSYGMKSPHLFLAWFVLRKLQPKAIIESGILHGQGTFFFERACPEAELHCIDPNLNQIVYRSARAQYYRRDFALLDWSSLPPSETLLFFDDHQNAYERLKVARWFGFKHVVFEDNYPPKRGDCYSLKKAFAHDSLGPTSDTASITRTKRVILRLAGKSVPHETELPADDTDERYLRSNIDAYRELPPVFRAQTTRWGDAWSEEDYPTPAPLLQNVRSESEKVFLEEATSYTWMCYVRLT